MSRALAIVGAAPTEVCRPWPRHILTAAQWSDLAREPLTLLAAWADTVQVHALYEDPATDSILPISVELDAGFYPALSPHHPGAGLYERMIRDLWGHMAAGGDDGSWLDHGHWPQTKPLAIRPGPRPPTADPPEFQQVLGDALMQWPIGPVGPGIGEAHHLRLTLDGTLIVKAESRLGYTHKGSLTLMRAKSPRIAARYAARLAGDATVAHSVAFAKATEAALSVQAPPRAVGLRGLMLRLERIATHLDVLGVVAGMVGSAQAQARCGVRQEYLRRGLAAAFGHRLMMDCVVPGGVSADADPNGLSSLRQVLGSLHAEVPIIRDLFGAGILAARLTGLGAASGGDAAKRCQMRLRAIDRDAGAAIDLLADLQEGPPFVALPLESGEGLAKAASARGEIWHWLRLDHGQIAAVFPRDPGWALWPMAETALVGAEARDAGLICASLGLPVSGMDL
jgi:Ni,Fe-hydrogenase III large subunit